MEQQTHTPLCIYNKAILLKKHLFATALLTLLPTSYIAAYPDWDNDPAGKTKVAIYFGFGIPNGGDNTYKDYDWRIRKPVGKVDIAPNIGLVIDIMKGFLE